MMSRGLVLINTARGALIDTAALYEGLHRGCVGAAGLDVLPTEPPNPLIMAWKENQESLHRLGRFSAMQDLPICRAIYCRPTSMATSCIIVSIRAN